MSKTVKNLLYFSVFLFVFYSCIPAENRNEKQDEKQLPQLDTLNFSQLIEMATTYMGTPYFDTICGLLNDTLRTGRYAEVLIRDSVGAEQLLHKNYSPLILVNDLKHEPIHHIRPRNLAEFYIENDSSFMIAGELATIDQINTYTKEFLINPRNSRDLSDKKTVENNLLGYILVSKGILLLKTKNSFNNGLSKEEWELFVKILSEFYKVYDDLRNEYSLKNYGLSFLDLDPERKIAVAKAYPVNITMDLLERNTPIRPKEKEITPPIEILKIIEEEDDDEIEFED